MRLHSRTLTAAHLQEARRAAGLNAWDLTYTEHGSRACGHAFEVSLTGTSPRRPNSGKYGATGDDHAATWDEWGMFLAYLYRVDDAMVCGSAKHSVYADADDFHWRTAGRFEHLTPDQQHRAHRWDSSGLAREQSCPCGAVRRWDIR